jgi:DNA-binding response OmpR family regulator
MVQKFQPLARFLLKMPIIDAMGPVEVIMNRQKILIVDDDAVIVKAMSMKLESAGYAVITAIDGTEAIASARKEKPDLILLDVNFPADVGISWDGFQIIAWLQRVDESKGTPVIVISGGEPAKFKARALQAGAIAYLQKPVDNNELIGLVKLSLTGSAKPASAK